MNIDFSKIKLIIWDLDDTFWKGTLSEGPVVAIDDNISLVRSLTDHGVVNSICSKNDKEPVELLLKDMGILNLFVFRSIDWTPKGQRIAQLIKDMGLRPQNCLFIDDNKQNLNEAKYYSPELMTAEPNIIAELAKYFKEKPSTDSQHSRLKNYHLLEQKQAAKAVAISNEAFLYSSMTQVQIHHDCLEQIDRIHELVNRTNQLNYTKLRSTKEELSSMLTDPDCNSGYVTVNDKFGDYGIVGFYAVKNAKCIHFLFSCRTIGQGVEQYVYATLGYPQLNVVGEVVNYVTHEPAPAWINQNDQTCCQTSGKNQHGKVIIKGNCDMKQMSWYLNTDTVIEEFTYIGKRRKNNIEFTIHSVNYLLFPFLSEAERKYLLEELVFCDEEMFDTHMYDDDVTILFLSTMVEPNLGIYRNKTTGMRIAFGEYLYPLTDSKCWDLYINNEIFTSDNHFTLEWLKDFSSKWDFVGHLSPEEILANAEILLNKISPKAKVCYFLGSETPFLNNTQPNYNDRHLVYKQINDLMREFAKKHSDRVLLLDFNDYIRGQEDFTNNINHFVRRVYYDVATKANEYIAASTGEKLQQKSRFYLWRRSLIDKIGATGIFQTHFYTVLRRFI